MERFFRRFGLPDDNSAPTIPRNPLVKQGSGFFISADGFAVTNNHVVEGVSSVDVTTDNGKVYTAKVVGADERTDVALIKVDGRSDFPTVKFAERIPRVGDWVLAVGNPFGLGGTVTAGIVSARGRDIGSGPYDDFIQIDAAVNVGNSGGPSFDIEGNVIGMNTAIVSPSGGSVGIGFAIPAETVKSVIAQLKDKGKVTRGWIGVQIQGITPDIAENLGLKEARGALVAEPQANGPAIRAGIEAGDVIIAINGKEVSDSREVARTISGMAPGMTVKLTVVRKGQEKIVNVTLGELPLQREAAVMPGTPEPRGGNIRRNEEARPSLRERAARYQGRGIIVRQAELAEEALQWIFLGRRRCAPGHEPKSPRADLVDNVRKAGPRLQGLGICRRCPSVRHRVGADDHDACADRRGTGKHDDAAHESDRPVPGIDMAFGQGCHIETLEAGFDETYALLSELYHRHVDFAQRSQETGTIGSMSTCHCAPKCKARPMNRALPSLEAA